MRLLPLLALGLLPAPAHAAAYGTTYALGSEFSTQSYYVSPFHELPSLDLRLDGMEFQLHALEFVVGIPNDLLLLGANGYLAGLEHPVSGGVRGVVKPGGSLDLATDLDFDNFNLALAGLIALGAEAEERMGMGVYVVPALGLGIVSEQFDLIVGGTLQVSVWVNGE